MITYEDFIQAINEGREALCALTERAVQEHQSSSLYKTAVMADRYYHLENPTIMRYQKLLWSMSGRATVDTWSPNTKIPSNWFFYFTTQAVSHLLGNGVYFTDEKTKKRLGRNLDRQLVRLATEAKIGGMAFGACLRGRMEVFTLKEFAPLFDPRTGKLDGGLRFLQSEQETVIEAYLPGQLLVFRRGDKETRLAEVIPYDEDFSPVIVPFYNILRQSDLAGNRHLIDAYDLMASGLINNVDEGNFIYWILKNCDGMNEEDDARFLDQLRRHHFAHAEGDDGAGVESHVVETPFEAHGAALDRLERQLFTNFMAVDVRSIAGGGVTATEIRAAYEPLNEKTDLFEYEAIAFFEELFERLEIEDVPLFKRSQIVNQAEETEMILSAASYLDRETVLKKLPWISVDEAEEILARGKGSETVCA